MHVQQQEEIYDAHFLFLALWGSLELTDTVTDIWPYNGENGGLEEFQRKRYERAESTGMKNQTDFDFCLKPSTVAWSETRGTHGNQ